jgi:hypothetical protein
MSLYLFFVVLVYLVQMSQFVLQMDWLDLQMSQFVLRLTIEYRCCWWVALVVDYLTVVGPSQIDLILRQRQPQWPVVADH